MIKSSNTSTEKKPRPWSISHSTATDAKKCGHYYYTKNVLKIYPENAGTIWTYYGTLTHNYIQAVLMDEMSAEVAAKAFIRTWFRFCQFWKKQLHQQCIDKEYKLPKGVKRPRDIYVNPARAIMNIKGALKKQFGEYKVLWVEYQLEQNTDFPQKFRGYVDLGIKLKDGTIIIADFKTCSSHFMFNKYRDKYKDYQLTFYKHFYSKQANVDPKKIETYFITIPKDPKIKKELEFVRVTSGKKKVENALEWLNETLLKVQHNTFQKNRMACRNFYGKNCPFFETIHCT